MEKVGLLLKTKCNIKMLYNVLEFTLSDAVKLQHNLLEDIIIMCVYFKNIFIYGIYHFTMKVNYVSSFF